MQSGNQEIQTTKNGWEGSVRAESKVSNQNPEKVAYAGCKDAGCDKGDDAKKEELRALN